MEGNLSSREGVAYAESSCVVMVVPGTSPQRVMGELSACNVDVGIFLKWSRLSEPPPPTHVISGVSGCGVASPSPPESGIKLTQLVSPHSSPSSPFPSSTYQYTFLNQLSDSAGLHPHIWSDPRHLPPLKLPRRQWITSWSPDYPAPTPLAFTSRSVGSNGRTARPTSSRTASIDDIDIRPEIQRRPRFQHRRQRQRTPKRELEPERTKRPRCELPT